MSRSARKTPISGVTTAKSEKQDKRLANRKLRRKVSEALGSLDEVAIAKSEALDKRNISNVWGFAKDGKIYFGNKGERVKKLMRK